MSRAYNVPDHVKAIFDNLEDLDDPEVEERVIQAQMANVHNMAKEAREGERPYIRYRAKVKEEEKKEDVP